MVNYPKSSLKRGRHGPVYHGGYSFRTKPEEAIRKNRKYIRASLGSPARGYPRPRRGRGDPSRETTTSSRMAKIHL